MTRRRPAPDAPSRPARPRGAAALALLPALLLGACGGGSDDEPAVADGPGTGAPLGSVATDGTDVAQRDVGQDSQASDLGADVASDDPLARLYGPVGFAMRFADAAETIVGVAAFGPEGRATTDAGAEMLVASDAGDWRSLVCASLGEDDLFCTGGLEGGASTLLLFSLAAGAGEGRGVFEYCPEGAEGCAEALFETPDGPLAVLKGTTDAAGTAPAAATAGTLVAGDIAPWLAGLGQAAE